MLQSVLFQFCTHLLLGSRSIKSDICIYFHVSEFSEDCDLEMGRGTDRQIDEVRQGKNMQTEIARLTERPPRDCTLLDFVLLEIDFRQFGELEDVVNISFFSLKKTLFLS